MLTSGYFNFLLQPSDKRVMCELYCFKYLMKASSSVTEK